MKIVIDEDLHRSLGETLKKLGHEVLDIRDYGLRGKTDEEVFAFAQQQNAVLCSADLGFANTLTFPLGSHYGIIILRFPNELQTKTINSIITALLPRIPEKEFGGHLLIISPAGVRIR